MAHISSTDDKLSITKPPSVASENASIAPERVPRASVVPPGSAHVAPAPLRPIPPSRNTSQEYSEKDNSPGYTPNLDASEPVPERRRRSHILLGAIIATVIVVLVIVLPVTLVHKRKNDNNPSPHPSPSPHSPTGLVTGGNGTLITTEDGMTFMYLNSLGGIWVDDPTDPYNSSARPQSYTPALNENFVYGTDMIRGVNLGGWLVTEPFIVPALYEKYQNVSPPAVDEWTLSVAMRNDTGPGGGIEQLEEHYKTFITEQDFAQIAAAGLNWIRLPVPYWAIETWPGEPYLASVAWNYALKGLKWARKYGLRVYLELHTAPGSQNGLNHSGRLGTINWLNSPMGIANAQRTMNHVRVLAEFISQPEYQDVVTFFGPINEPLMGIIGRDVLNSFYLETYQMIRNITGIGKGPYIVVHDGFQGLTPWKDFLPGADRLVLDTHPYVAFGGGLDQPLDYWPTAACRGFQVNQSNIDFGLTITGEFSAAINDCGKWLKNVGAPSEYPDCGTWDDWPTWTQDMKDGVKKFVLASMDAMHMPGYFFWTWKIGNSSVTGIPTSPMWSYQLGLQNGWMPTDPRQAVGTCDALGVQFNLPVSTYKSWQTGGASAGQVDPAATATLEKYPPTVSNANNANPTLLPYYTLISANPTLPTPTYSGATVTAGDGWADAQDTMLAPAPVPGCVYPDAWAAPAESTAFVCTTPTPTA